MLEAYLGFQRETLLGKCTGLDAAGLRARSVEPSAMSLLGIVRHLAAVERWWFRNNMAGEQLPYLFFDETNMNADFEDVDIADPEADFATYAAELVLVDAAVARFSLEDTFFSKSRNGDRTLRWVYLHMIEEYARHNGHADLLRERIDGVTGE
jgi:hypothetical protein